MALVGQICAGIDVAKAQRLLTFFIDETELDCSSLQSMVLTIKDEGGLVRNVTLDGVTLLTMKTAEAAADATVDTFTTTREILETVKQKYITAITKYQGTERMAGMTMRDWVDDFGAETLTASQIQASADEMFGDPKNCHESLLESGSSDHCGGAQAALRGF